MTIKKVCPVPGCSEIIELDERACKAHLEKYNRKQTRQKRERTSARGYGYEWQVKRLKHLREFPFCEVERCSNQADEVHHVKPLSQGGTHDDSNLRSLCFDHHHELHETDKPLKFRDRLKEQDESAGN
jgi:5-methylcytosine-specific restriction protein A